MPLPRLFLSHATADKKLVEAFEELLSKATGTLSDNIFVSSLEGQGVPKGSNFVDHIRERVKEADAVIALISPAYLESPFCMAELGAAWALGTHRYPVIIPPVTFAEVNSTQLGLTAIVISDGAQLDQMMADLNEAIGTTPPKAGIRRRAIVKFEDEWTSLAEKIVPAQRVAKEIHDQALSKILELETELGDADEEIRQNEKQIKRLRATKDRAEVEKIDHEFRDEDIEGEFQRHIDDIVELADDLGGPVVLRHAIMDHYDRAGSIDWNCDGGQFEVAVQHGVFDPDSKDFIWGSSDLNKLRVGLEAIGVFLAEKGDASFLTDNDRRGPDDARFWNERI